MLLTALRLVTVLNTLDAGLLGAAEAEHAIAGGGDLHQVSDPDGVLGSPATGPLSLRVALARIEHGSLRGGWALAPCTPGHPRGLRGPRPLTRRLTAESRPAVVLHTGGALWEGHAIPADGVVAVQWRLWAAERPSLSLFPSDAGLNLTRTVVDAAARLEAIDLPAGRRAVDREPPVAGWSLLGPAYPPASTLLADRALTLLSQIGPAREASPEVLHSHATLAREGSLATVEEAALDALSAAASWPTHLMT